MKRTRNKKTSNLLNFTFNMVSISLIEGTWDESLSRFRCKILAVDYSLSLYKHLFSFGLKTLISFMPNSLQDHRRNKHRDPFQITVHSNIKIFQQCKGCHWFLEAFGKCTQRAYVLMYNHYTCGATTGFLHIRQTWNEPCHSVHVRTLSFHMTDLLC